MADEEAEQDRSSADCIIETIGKLRQRLEILLELITKENDSPVQSSSEYCQEFCRTLLEFAGCWNIDEEPLPLVKVYIVALLSYAQASPYLSLECENVPLVIERLSLSFLELLLSVRDVPQELWNEFKSSVQCADSKLQENGVTLLPSLSVLGHYDGAWTHRVLETLMSNSSSQTEEVEEFLEREGMILLQLRVKQLMKEKQLEKAALLAKTCSDSAAFRGKGGFKQMYLVCLCGTLHQDQLMEELSKEDCHDALDMICNLESDGDDTAAFSLCTAFLTRQFLRGDTYCAWELTLFWSKLLKRLEPSDHAFLDKCRQMSQLSKTVYHILFLIKVVQSEIEQGGLPACIELCIKALQIETDDRKTKSPVYKTISCLLPSDLEVKRACQLTEFLLEPTVDAYYAVETLYNEPDQKLDEVNMSVPNSLRCELLLVFKTQWPFDPEFWDWKTLKRHCLELMGEEASIVSSIDSLNDTETPDEDEDCSKYLNNVPEHVVSGTYEFHDSMDRKQKNREMKKLREKGFISARFRNWQAYMQYCMLCDKEFLGHRIVRHAQTHVINGTYTCPICAQTFSSKDLLIPHVTSHVQQSCKERLAAMKTNRSLSGYHATPHVTTALKLEPRSGPRENGDSFPNGDGLLPNGRAIMAHGGGPEICEENMCPVGTCRRSFKFFKNLIAHIKGHGDDEEAKTFLEMRSKKVVCQYCRRHFISVTHLNDHLQVHCGARPYICIQLNCRASFMSNGDLLTHKRTHAVFKAKCMFPNCGKIFNAAFKLYDHEAQHYKTFTCKVGDCGKVFHSQQQLDLHREKHAALKQESQTSERPIERPGQSLVEQPLNTQLVIKQEPPEENANNESAFSSIIGKLPEPEGLLESSQQLVETQSRIKTESDFRASSSVIKTLQSHLHKANSQSAHSEGCVVTPNHPVHPHQANVGNPKVYLSSNTDLGRYISGCKPQVLPQQASINVLPAAQPRMPGQPAMSQPLPPTVNPQHQLTIKPTPPSGQKERFHCAFGTCERQYCAYRSLSKHMKAAHPDFYEKWKAARTKIKITYAPVQSTPPLLSTLAPFHNQQVHGVQRQNVIQSPPYRESSSNYPPQQLSNYSQSSSLVMGNVLNPIVLSQLGSDERNPAATASQLTANKNWHATNENKRMHNSYPLDFPSNLQVIPAGNSTGDAQPQPASSASASDSLQSHLMSSRTQSIIASNRNHAKELAHRGLTPCSVQIKDAFASCSSTSEKMKIIKSFKASNCSSSLNFTRIKSESDRPQNVPQTSPGGQKKVRKHTRTKCPAIIRNGKFICRRCFREFESPKSLGGHLSKGTSCKPYQEAELNGDLPRSFLDFLNSEKVVGSSESELPYSGAAADQKPNYPRNNPEQYGNGEPNNDMLKQIMAQSNMSDLFMQGTVPSPLIPKPSTPYGAGERLHGSVIQHTENLQLKQEDTSYSSAYYPQQTIQTCPRSEFPEPLLSQMLSDNPSTSTLAASPVNPGTPGQLHREDSQSEMTNSDSNPTSELQDKACQSASNWKEKAAEMDVKKRLREQILAGDFHRRNVPESKPGPVSLTPTHSPSSNPGLNRFFLDANSSSSGPEPVCKASVAIIPGSPSEIKQLLSSQSFTCLRAKVAQQEAPTGSTSVLPDSLDPEPSEPSVSQQQGVVEIQSALERLDLIREIPETKPPPQKWNPVPVSTWTPAEKSQSPELLSPIFVKPFACQNCPFSSISSDALWKHLSKVHNYTLDMVNDVKKKYGQYAPFKCQKCFKSFTRNSNLRAHYSALHKLTQAEIAELDVKRRLANTTTSGQRGPVAVSDRRANHSQPYNGIKTEPFFPSVTNYKSPDDSRPSVLHTLQSRTVIKQEPIPHASADLSVQAGTLAQQRNVSKVPNQHFESHVSPKTFHPSMQNFRAAPFANALLTPEKAKSKKSKPGNPTSPYRPYRCVHQGCMAAFTIQHNLILHYRSVHQSALSALEVNKDQDQSEELNEMDHEEEPPPPEDLNQITEFRCRVKDCCCVFQEVPALLQHYFLLHKFTLERVESILLGIRLGLFTCGHNGCSRSFTTMRRYVNHAKEEHKDLNLAKPEQLNVSFRCEIEGCDRSYATKSNLLRHVMKKHQDLYVEKPRNVHVKANMIKQKAKALHYKMTKTINGKENIESNKKILLRAHKKRVGRSTNPWVKYGKPSLKSKLEASAMCTKKFHLQYPCMIKGCDQVMKSERNITKHYKGHGLSEKYVEQHRSYFIYCRKFARLKFLSMRSDDSKSDSDQSDDDDATTQDAADANDDDTKPVLRRRMPPGLPLSFFESKLTNESSKVLKRKRGRPRKFIEKITKRKKLPSATKTSVIYRKPKEYSPSEGESLDDSHTAPLSSFKPMGFEMSFLKFLEQSNKSEHSLNEAEGTKSHQNPKTKDTRVRFRNRQKLRSLDRVKINLDFVFTGFSEPMLEQLQDMYPAVVLTKCD